jgi:hypothetical protein
LLTSKTTIATSPLNSRATDLAVEVLSGEPFPPFSSDRQI